MGRQHEAGNVLPVWDSNTWHQGDKGSHSLQDFCAREVPGLLLLFLPGISGCSLVSPLSPSDSTVPPHATRWPGVTVMELKVTDRPLGMVLLFFSLIKSSVVSEDDSSVFVLCLHLDLLSTDAILLFLG